MSFESNALIVSEIIFLLSLVLLFPEYKNSESHKNSLLFSPITISCSFSFLYFTSLIFFVF